MEILVSQRFRNLASAISWALIAKVTAAAMQLLAIPVAIEKFGLETYSLYLIATAVSFAPLILQLRFGPPYISMLAEADHKGDTTSVNGLFWKGVRYAIRSNLLVFSIGIPITGLLYFVLGHAGKEYLRSEFIGSLTVLWFIGFIGAVCQVIESAQVSLNKSSQLSRMMIVANAAIFLCLYLSRSETKNILVLTLVLQGIPFLARLITSVVFLWQHREIFFPVHSDCSGPILKDAVAYTVSAGLCNYLLSYAPVLVLNGFSKSESADVSAVLLQITLQCLGVFSAVLFLAIPVVTQHVEPHGSQFLTKLRIVIYVGVVLLSFALIAILRNYVELFQQRFGVSKEILLSTLYAAGALFVALAFESMAYFWIVTRCKQMSSVITHLLSGSKGFFAVAGVATACLLGVPTYSLGFAGVAVLVFTAIPMMCMFEQFNGAACRLK